MPRARILLILLLAASQTLLGCALPTTPPAPPVPAAPTSATAGATTIVAIAPPASTTPPPSLCTFLGLDKTAGLMGGLFRRVTSRLKTALGLEGRFPGLQAKPPLLGITDPANLSADAPPAVKAAAEAKMEEDQAAQKIQALRYLATIGCGGCYPAVEEAILAALDDCTEAVRYEAVLALRGNGNTCCAYCSCSSCCSPNVRKKLNDIATLEEDGCFVEPSERVRRLARTVLAACGGYVAGAAATPGEGPTPAPPPGEGPTASTSPISNTLALEPIRRSAVQLVSYEATTAGPSTHDTVLARVNGEPLYESQILPLLEAESARRRARGEITAPDQFQGLLAEQLERAIDAKLLLQQAHRDLAAGGRVPAPLSEAEFHGWLQQAIDVDPYVSLLELTQHYQANRAQFEVQPEVSWEQITISVAAAGSREKAMAVAAALRNRALKIDLKEPEVDVRIAETNVVPVTPMQDVRQKVLVPSLTSLPVGQLSPILEDAKALYMVRVLDRKAAGGSAFDEVAGTIRKQILETRRSAAERALLYRLRSEAEVWSALRAAKSTAGDGVRSYDVSQIAAAPTARLPAQAEVMHTPIVARHAVHHGVDRVRYPVTPATTGLPSAAPGAPTQAPRLPPIPAVPTKSMPPMPNTTPTPTVAPPSAAASAPTVVAGASQVSALGPAPRWPSPPPPSPSPMFAPPEVPEVEPAGWNDLRPLPNVNVVEEASSGR